jgi:AraC-like DNA-binding protein
MTPHDKLPAFHFDRHAHADPRVEEDLRQAFGENFELVLPDATPPAARVELRGHMLGGMAVLERTMSAHGVVRDARHIRASQLDHYCLRVPSQPDDSGADAHASGNAREQDLAHGPVFVDMGQPLRFGVPAGSDILLFVPRDSLDALLPHGLDLHGAAPRGPASTLLGKFVRALAARIDELHGCEARALSLASLHMMAAALLPISASLPLAPPRSHQILLRRIGHFIDEHLSDPDLSPAHLGEAFRLSRSTLYRTLEPVGGPATFIRERRLAHAHALLAGARRRVHLKRAAVECGFKDASNFSRAFRTQYGYSPREALAHSPVAGGVMAGAQGAAPAGSVNPFSGWLQALRA